MKAYVLNTSLDEQERVIKRKIVIPYGSRFGNIGDILRVAYEWERFFSLESCDSNSGGCFYKINGTDREKISPECCFSEATEPGIAFAYVHCMKGREYMHHITTEQVVEHYPFCEPRVLDFEGEYKENRFLEETEEQRQKIVAYLRREAINENVIQWIMEDDLEGYDIVKVNWILQMYGNIK